MKKIAVICNYVLKPDRIGGMDRFFYLFDKQAKEKGYNLDWYFTDYSIFNFYKNLNIYSANNSSVEQKFLEMSSSNKYDVVLCTLKLKSELVTMLTKVRVMLRLKWYRRE